MPEPRPSLASQPDIDAFIDAVWLEDGLSANTLVAYRRDLTGFARWLEAVSYTHLTLPTNREV